ncbi:LuxR family transcriptional regulator [Streptomyces sp. TP-A0356]|uniref:helix-turn-helix transcriptional regulator n=1 Tax=Streptomyces sp. TP-A0356 TaxID=1359208 RepID=UPI0006E17761|nr:LuxR family transcriptional regulator [Streptomyces sp. TP-A0356]
MLLERESELAVMAEALRGEGRSQGSFTVVQGAFGTGKSALLQVVGELGRELGALVLRAQAAATEREFSFGVARQLAEPVLVQAAESDAEHWVKEAAEQAGLPAPKSGRWAHDLAWPPMTQHQSRVWLDALVNSMARDRAVLIMVDDVHWADSESLQTLLRTARARRRRTLLVCSVMAGDVRTARPSVRDLLALGDRTVDLPPLSTVGTRKVIETVFEEAPDAAFIHACQDRSGGNPLLLRAIVDDAQFHGLRPTARDAAAAAALRPAQVRRRLLAFLQSLPDHILRTARAMTVLGEHTAPQLLTELAALDEARHAEALLVLRRTGVVDDPARGLTVGTVLRDVLEESMPLEERAAMRGMAAELLHRTGHPVEHAAEHLMSVVSLQDRDAVAILRTAADSALRRGSARDAARYLHRALLDTSAPDPDRARVLIDLAHAERSFATAASQRHMAEAVRLLGTVQERAAALARLGPLLVEPGVLCIDGLMRGVSADLSSSGSPDVLDRDLALRLEAREHCLAAQDRSRLPMALRRLRELGPQPSLRTVGERELVNALIHLSMVANAAPADELAQLATRLLAHEPPSPAHVHTTLPLTVNILAAAGQTAGAARWLREAHRLAERRGGDVEQAVIRAEQALIALADGNLASARAKVLHADALAGPEMSGFPTVCAAVLAIVALNTGEPELAEHILTQHRLSAENQHLAALLHMARGVLAARRSEARVALDHFRVAGQHMEQIGWRNPVTLPWSSCAALMHHRLGEVEQAIVAGRTEVERARRWGAPTVLGRALVVLGRVIPGHGGAEVLEEAVDVLEKGTNGYELCRALYALGKRPETDSARREISLKRALALATECDSAGLTERIRQFLGNHENEPPKGAPSLTRSENRVTRLAVAGMSNQEISATLKISLRMVEKHLTSSYRKLGISGRPSLPDALAELDSRTDT